MLSVSPQLQADPWALTRTGFFMRARDISGQRFGRLLAVEWTGISSGGGRIWSCLCDCGMIANVAVGNLVSENTASCGCLKKELSKERCLARAKYNKNEKRILNIRKGMISRCYMKYSNRYEYYGGRGISVCEEWLHSKSKFIEWAVANGHNNGLQIDRINVNGNYEPSNCRFVTNTVQQNNKTTNHLISWDNKTMTISEWEMFLGWRKSQLRTRIGKGWSVERAMTQPFRKRRTS